MPKLVTLLVVANERRARFLENTGPGAGLIEVAELAPAPTAGFADRKGRMQMQGGARHGFEPHTTPQNHDRAAFAKQVVDAIANHATARPFERLMIAAPPKLLGLLRIALPSDLKSRLIYDTPLDLVDERCDDLAPHFAGQVTF